jgi:hypothetical protein
MRHLFEFHNFDSNLNNIKNDIEDILIEIFEKVDLNIEKKLTINDGVYHYTIIINNASTMSDEDSEAVENLYKEIHNKRDRIKRFFNYNFEVEINRRFMWNPINFDRVLIISISLFTPKQHLKHILANESVEYRETIEDCFTDFSDTYELDINIDEGHLVNGSYITGKLLPDVIKLASDNDTKIEIKDCYRITFVPKTHRYTNALTEFGESWKESINNDFKNAISKMNKLKGIKIDGKIPEIKPSFWSLTIYAVN